MGDYEKKYKEALELARVAAFNGHQSLMEGIFPELAESEDEKTRKRITALVNAHGQGMYKDDMLTWLENIPYTIDHEKREGFHLGYKAALEKQDEKSLTVDIESMIEAYEQRLINQGNGVRNSPIVNMCVAAFKHGVENTLDELHLKQGETSPILSNSSNIGKNEQKPARSEEDINKPNGGIVVEDFNDGNGFYKVNLAYLNEEQVEQIEELVKRWNLQPKGNEDESIISDLLDYFDEDKCLKHEVNDIVKWLKTIKPQQKGWGENEIKMLDNLITYLDGRKDLLEEIKRTYIDWLKSLKQRIGG